MIDREREREREKPAYFHIVNLGSIFVGIKYFSHRWWFFNSIRFASFEWIMQCNTRWLTFGLDIVMRIDAICNGNVKIGINMKKMGASEIATNALQHISHLYPATTHHRHLYQYQYQQQPIRFEYIVQPFTSDAAFNRIKSTQIPREIMLKNHRKMQTQEFFLVRLECRLNGITWIYDQKCVIYAIDLHKQGKMYTAKSNICEMKSLHRNFFGRIREKYALRMHCEQREINTGIYFQAQNQFSSSNRFERIPMLPVSINIW